jgi:hypothetical protein
MKTLAEGLHNFACAILLYKQTATTFEMKNTVFACIAHSEEEATGMALKASKEKDSSTSWTREVIVVLIDYLEED